MTILYGAASFVDPHTLAIEGDGGRREVTAEHIVIAVGTQPAAPPGVKSDGEVVLDTDDMVRLKQLPRTMCVVGAGVIGIAPRLRARGMTRLTGRRRDRHDGRNPVRRPP